MGLNKNKLVKNKRYSMENMRIFNVHTMTIELKKYVQAKKMPHVRNVS